MTTSYTVIIVTLSLYVGSTSNLQDLRDVEGDKKTGRLTIPVCFGMSTAKKLLSIMFTTLPIFLFFTIWNHSLQPVTLFKLVYIFADILAHLYIVIRLLYLDHTYVDLHHTYHFFTKTFPFTVMSATVLVD